MGQVGGLSGKGRKALNRKKGSGGMQTQKGVGLNLSTEPANKELGKKVAKNRRRQKERDLKRTGVGKNQRATCNPNGWSAAHAGTELATVKAFRAN